MRIDDDGRAAARTAIAVVTAMATQQPPEREATLATLLYDDDIDREHLIMSTVTLATWLMFALEHGGLSPTGFVQRMGRAANQ